MSGVMIRSVPVSGSLRKGESKEWLESRQRPKGFSLACCRASPAPASWADHRAVLGSVEEEWDSALSAGSHNPLSEPPLERVGMGPVGFLLLPRGLPTTQLPGSLWSTVRTQRSAGPIAHDMV